MAFYLVSENHKYHCWWMDTATIMKHLHLHACPPLHSKPLNVQVCGVCVCGKSKKPRLWAEEKYFGVCVCVFNSKVVIHL